MKQGFDITDAAVKKGEKLFRQECIFIAGAQRLVDIPPMELPEVAFAGRSNVGKSSLINALTGRKALARASATPGRTQQLNFFKLGDSMQLVDLPGYGYAVASKTKVEHWNAVVQGYLKNRQALRRVFVLIDARHGIMAADQETMETLDKASVPYVCILTKADKTRPADLAALVEKVEGELDQYKCAFPKIYVTSAANGGGISTLRAILTLV
ncbi:MAG: ribosome biogenesis GTP-binding protein YihA/YsxC [Micavibrio sp.]|nr:ribosome biogenesis GTP-binding protein YihA/YsxC [Micavibrio sp.]